MSLMSKIRDRLVGASRADRIVEALDATEDVVSTARELRRTIEPYAKLDDPFIALWMNHFEAEQERRIHMGPKE